MRLTAIALATAAMFAFPAVASTGPELIEAEGSKGFILNLVQNGDDVKVRLPRGIRGQGYIQGLQTRTVTAISFDADGRVIVTDTKEVSKRATYVTLAGSAKADKVVVSVR